MPQLPGHAGVQSLLLRLVGRANCVYFLEQAGSGDPHRREILDWLGPPPPASVLGNRRCFDDACDRNAAGYLKSRVDVLLPVHVFPIHEKATLDTGFVVPLDSRAAGDWEVSDAFGAFGAEYGASPLQVLMSQLRLVEETYHREHGSALPARWLRPQALKLLCPLHIDILAESGSAQLPLLVAVLRALSETADGRLPWGRQPVFSTGTIDAHGDCGPVAAVPEKLMAFVRELGSGHTAILTSAQIAVVRDSRPELLDQVRIIEVNGVADLVRHPDLAEGLHGLAERYHPSLNERLMTTAATLGRNVDFSAAATVYEWVGARSQTEAARRDYYSQRTALELALIAFHKGRSQDGSGHLAAALESYRRSSHLFGVDDLGHMFAVTCQLAIDARHVAPLLSLRDETEAAIDAMTVPRRVEVYGSLCQFHRFFGPVGEAIAAGRAAVAIADQAWASRAGQSRNYLAHALIVAARSAVDGERASLLEEARRLLHESETEWAPLDHANSRRIHLGFCAHLRAEVARVAGEPLQPPASAAHGVWSHPRMFQLLACGRNSANDRLTRLQCLEELLVVSSQFRNRHGDHSLFALLDGVYQLTHAVYAGVPQAPPLGQIERWLACRADEGFPGWQQHLGPPVHPDMSERDIDLLCDAIGYH